MTVFVDLFFVISGFVIAYVYAGRLNDWSAYVTFLQRRIARLAPLHWATFLVFFLVGVMIWTGSMPSDHPEFYDPRCIVPNVVAIHAWGVCDHLSFNDVSWSISAEVGMYIISPLLLLLGTRSPIWLALLSVVVIVLLSLAPQQPWLDWTSHFGVLRALPSFALGMAAMYWRGTITHLPLPRVVGLLAFALLLVGIRLDWSRLALLPIAYMIVVAAIAADVGGRFRPLRIGALGQLTYSLYMIHPLVRTFFIGFAGQRVFHVEGRWADLWVLAGFGVTFVLSYVSFLYFETPARRMLSKKRGAAAAAA